MRRATFSSLTRTISIFVLLVLAGCLYLLFLNQSVVHVVTRTDVERSIADVQTEIAYLEAQLIDSQFLITERLAALDNFQTDADKIFITRGDSSLVLRLD